MKPETITAPASVSANSTKSRPVRPGVNASGANTAASVSVIATTAKPISFTPFSAAWNGAQPFLDVPEDVLEHDDRIVDDEADREHEREQSQCVDGEAGERHQREGADQADRYRDQRNDRRAQGAQEHEHDQRDQDRRLGHRAITDLIERSMNTALSFATCTFSPAGRSCWICGITVAHAVRHLEWVGCRVADDAGGDRRHAVQPHAAALAGRRLLDARHVA